MDLTEAARVISELRSQLASFQDQSAQHDAFASWRDRVLNALEHIFGNDSWHYQEFKRIQFVFPVSPSSESRKALLDAAREKVGQPVKEDVDFGTSHYYQERLSEADEVLAAAILKIQA